MYFKMIVLSDYHPFTREHKKFLVLLLQLFVPLRRTSIYLFGVSSKLETILISFLSFDFIFPIWLDDADRAFTSPSRNVSTIFNFSVFVSTVLVCVDVA